MTRTGTIKKIKGNEYGFINDGNGLDIFVLYTGVKRPAFQELKEGGRVEFTTIDTAKRVKAVGIAKIDNRS